MKLKKCEYNPKRIIIVFCFFTIKHFKKTIKHFKDKGCNKRTAQHVLECYAHTGKVLKYSANSDPQLIHARTITFKTQTLVKI